MGHDWLYHMSLFVIIDLNSITLEEIKLTTNLIDEQIDDIK